MKREKKASGLHTLYRCLLVGLLLVSLFPGAGPGVSPPASASGRGGASGNPARAAAAGGAVPPRRFLNDRVADLTAARPLAVAAVAVPEGLTGRGQLVGLADSGLDVLHPDLQSSDKKKKIVTVQSLAGRAIPGDPNGHGTHMAATIAGTGAASNGKFRGMAPGASLYVQALLNEEGEVSPPANLDALFYPAYAAGVRVHVNGWGGGLNEYREAAAQIDAFCHRYPDFLPVFGAGNAGPAQGSLSAEANSKNALVVGASGNPRPALDPETTAASVPAPFSSRGPSEDGRLKPELLAPGQAVVSARSRLVEGNFPANEAYTVLSGTSMAAAVTGGSLALLREYLQAQEGLASPSAALLKALLINGARVPAAGPGKEGFGILDLAATVLSLKEKTYRYLDAHAGLATGETYTTSLPLTPGGPLKVTLTWTDPPGEPGRAPTLVNDLDLVVTAPDGRVYYGNHFLYPGDEPDRRNNVEQVYLAHPPAGTYTITVKAVVVRRGSGTAGGAPRQGFALVWGQAPVTGIIASWDPERTLVLADGRRLPWPQRGEVVVNGQRRSLAAENLLAGADLYLFPEAAYVFGRTWETPAGQAVPGRGGPVFMEADAGRREGGYLWHPASRDPPLVNGTAYPDLTALPPGGALWASINPSSQQVWQVAIYRREQTGILAQVDGEKRQLWLLKEKEPYTLAPEASISFLDRLVEASTADAPFAACREARLGDLAPGLRVRLVLGPKGNTVYFLAVERHLAMGRLRAVRAEDGEIVLETGRSFRLFPQAPVWRDDHAGTLADLRPGDHVTVVLLPDESQVVTLVAYSQVSFGRVLYAGNRPRKLYLVDEENRFRSFPLDRTKIYRWGQPVPAAALVPGSWVRLILDPEGKEVRRVDLGETAEEKSGVLAGYDAAERTLRLADGSAYPLSSAALITKEGYALSPEDLVPGENIHLAALAAPPPWEKVAVGIRVELAPDAVPPRLVLQTRSEEGGFLLSGTTSADRLYLYRADGTRQEIPVATGGYFASFFNLEQEEETIRVVGLERQHGGLISRKLTVRRGFGGFTDSGSHWAAGEIAALAQKGLLGGYPDGTFRPAAAAARIEVVAALVRLYGSRVTVGAIPVFRDATAVPGWGRAALAAAQQEGLAAGYPDGTFQPQKPASRAELAAFCARLLAGRLPTLAPVLPYADSSAIPAWARPAVALVHAAGILRGREANLFAPLVPATRGEMAAALYRCRLLVPVP